MTSLSELPQYRQLSPTLHSSGQPDAGQLDRMKEWGIEAVINLALPTSDHAVADEAVRLTGQGLTYLQVPVDFSTPQEREFRQMAALLDQLAERQVLVHCAYNMRVSAFLFLYRILHQGVPRTEAERDLHALWRPEGVWEEFVELMLRRADSV